MTITFTPAKRENVPLLLGVAGGTGSGKTMSALRLARGLADGNPFAFIDTENGRGQHYADLFPEMMHADITAPFRPEKYLDALTAATSQYGVTVVDSFSHEWAGDGGCLDWQEELMGGNQAKSPVAWAKVKREHKRLVTRMTQMPAHIIVCLRAEPRVDIVRKDGAIEFVPKKTLAGGSLDGWLPVSEKMFPYELTASFLLMSDTPGVPRPIKLQEQHKAFVPLDAPLSEETGRALARWAGSVEESKAGEEVKTAGVSGLPVSQAADDEPASSAALELNDLVVTLIGDGHITLEQIRAVAGAEFGSWTEIQAGLTTDQITDLLTRLTKYQKNLGKVTT